MPKIIITETDATRSVISEEAPSNVVYIPGFSKAVVNPEAIWDNYVPTKTGPNGVPAGYPKLCRTVSEFLTYFGNEPVTFDTAQAYPVQYNQGIYVSGFNATALNGISSGDMFEAGDADPSWLMAYDLLTQDIPVLYERVNTLSTLTNVSGTCVPTVADPSTILEVESFDATTFVNATSWMRVTSTLVYDGSVEGEEKWYFQDDLEKTAVELDTVGIILSATSAPATDDYLTITMSMPGRNSSAAPTSSTEGYVGMYDVDISAAEGVANLYLCTAANSGSYTWLLTEDTSHYESITNLFASNTVQYMYGYLATCYSTAAENTEKRDLSDKNEFDIKYITSGGYPVFEYDIATNGVITGRNRIANDMISLAAIRGDAIALIDHVNNPTRPLTGSTSVYETINTSSSPYALSSNYAAMFTPWVYHNYTFSGADFAPGSFLYLLALADTVKSSPNWLAIAGVTRGLIPGAGRPAQRLTNAVADSYVDSMTRGGVCINPITNIKNYGLTIWGNRTLELTTPNTEKALYYLNMRSLVCEIKKVCYRASQQLMFEQNSDVLWINFKSKVMPLLDKLASSNGVSGYKIIKLDSEKKTEVKALIRLYPIYAVESFDINITLTNEDVEVEEE